MNTQKNLLDKMRDLRRQLREGGPQAATVAIQQALQDAGLAGAPVSGQGASAQHDGAQPHRAPFSAFASTFAGAPAGQPIMHDINPPPAGKASQASSSDAPTAASAAPASAYASAPGEGAAAAPFAKGLAAGLRGLGKHGFAGADAGEKTNDFVNDLLAKLKVSGKGVLAGGMGGRPAAQELPAGAKFISGSFGNAAGSRHYKLYVPASAGEGSAPLPLVVMLHGCTQDPDDFAAGTQMNAAAEAQGCLVLYPQQSQGANSSKCWNWFNAADQQRDAGEPSIIADMTREIMAQQGVDASQVYVAGLSAGGAMAAILGVAYPDLYAGVAVHSGLPVGAATDLPSALAAMRSGASGTATRSRSANGQTFKGIPLIVFHGDADHTVNRRNGDQVIAGTAPASAGAPRRTDGKVPDGHAYTRTVHADAAGTPVAEHWLIHGFGHAWSGGSAAGSYTDARGPDATAEMMRFFKTHRKAA